jgi:ElaB/YqjD/DUF883 family membrane-anchored ribosome-binding protein
MVGTRELKGGSDMRNIRGINRSRRQLYSEFESMREDLSNLRHDLLAFGQALLKSGKSELGGAGSKLRGDLQKTIESLSESMGGARSIQTVEQQVQERPFTSLGIAFALGLVVGKLIDLPSLTEE